MRYINLCWLSVALILAFGFSLVSRPASADEPSSTAQLSPAPQPKPITPPTAEARRQGIQRGIQFLLDDQNPDGSWGSAERTKGLNIYAPVPGAHHAFRSAVTSLCIAALIETGGDAAEVRTAVDRGEQWLIDYLPRVRRATPDALYNVWSHAYSIQALVRLCERHSKDSPRRAELVELIESQIGFLDRYESVDGGWGYYDFDVGSKKPAASSTSFVSATGLVALHEARQMGIEVPDRIVQRAVDSIHRQQKPDFSYAYGEYLKYHPMHPINRPGGSLGRSQACNVALRLWGDERITDEVLSVWLDRLFARNGWLSIGRKRPIPHESWFSVAGYFYYYGHYYGALCIEQLPAAEQPHYRDYMAHTLLELQEKDGSWWDYPLYNYHQQYGTAFALMTLARSQSTSDELSLAH